MPDSETDDSDLKTRVDRLEEVCREQQATIQKLMPSRRSVLAGAAGLGIGAASMSATSGSAAAQSAPGQIGTSSEPVDIEGAQGNFQALEAEDVSIGGAVFKRVERIELANDQQSVNLTGLSNDNEYRLFYDSRIENGGLVGLRLNGDGDATGNYFYWDKSGAKKTDQDEILLTETSGATSVGGSVTLIDSRFGKQNRDATNHKMLSAGPPDRIVDFAREGGRDVADGLSSLEMVISGSGVFVGGESVFELWERDYSTDS